MDAEETSIIEERDRNAISGEKYQGGVTMNKESDDISTGSGENTCTGHMQTFMEGSKKMKESYPAATSIKQEGDDDQWLGYEHTYVSKFEKEMSFPLSSEFSQLNFQARVEIEKLSIIPESSYEDMDSDSYSQKNDNLKEEQMEADQQVYCICRTSDIDRFMIGCDNCTEWFHGDCINLSKHEAKKIKAWYCKLCQERNPALAIAYRVKKIKEPKESKSKAKRISRMCGECLACKNAEDCGQCDFCKDKRKFGGQDKIRQKCRLRQCLKLSTKISNLQGKFQYPEDYIQQFKAFQAQRSLDNSSQESFLSSSQTSLPSTEDNSSQDSAKKIEDEVVIITMKDGVETERTDSVEVLMIDSPPKKKAIKVKHAKQPVQDKEKKRKEKEEKERLKKEQKERKMRELQKKKEEREERRRKAAEERKRRLSTLRSEAATMKKQEAAKDKARHCLGPGCINAARSNSKYCSDECGVQLALRRLQEILPSRKKIWKETAIEANLKAEQKLEELRIEQEGAQKKLLEYDKKYQELEAIVERAKELTVNEDHIIDDTVEGDIDLTTYCVSCGLPCAPKVVLRHMEKCYTKLECLMSFGSTYRSVGNLFCDTYNAQQGTYCKRLRVLCPEHTKDPKVGPDEVCGCPLVNQDYKESSELCRAPKRKCTRHHFWEKLRRAEIDLQRLQEWWKLEDALEQERSIRVSMANRGGVVGVLLHETIDHSKSETPAVEAVA